MLRMRNWVMGLVMIGLLSWGAEVSNAQVLRGATGQYSAGRRQGNVQFTTVEAIRIGNRIAFIGDMLVNNQLFPGLMYATPEGKWYVAWVDAMTGRTIADALMSLQADQSWFGPLKFYGFNGRVAGQGTITMTLQF